MKIVSYDNHGARTEGYICLFSTTCENHPPEYPKINGPNDGVIGEEYEFSFSAVDPEGQNVSFYIEWGDGTSDGWTNYVTSGVDIKYSHTWFKQDNYFIRCKAKDVYDFESDWTYYIIIISKSKQIINLPFLQWLDRFPLLNQLIIRLIEGRI